MEGKFLCGHGIPGKVERRLSEIRTGKAIGADGIAGLGFKSGEEPTDEPIGNLIEQLPASFGTFGGGEEKLIYIFRDQPHKIRNTGADAKVHAGIEIELKIHVSGIVFQGLEEELQAAVFAGRADRASFLSADGGKLRPKMNMKCIIAPTNLCPGTDIIRGV